MAMTIGLHMPTQFQSFAKGKVSLTEPEISYRANLWAHCLIVHGRMCSLKGIAAMRTQASTNDPSNLIAASKRISPRLAYHLHIHRVVMRCCLAIQKNGLITLSEDQERAMEILAHIFVEQLRDIEHKAHSGEFSHVSVQHDSPRCSLSLLFIRCETLSPGDRSAIAGNEVLSFVAQITIASSMRLPYSNANHSAFSSCTSLFPRRT